MHVAPVQTLQQCAELGRGDAHHAVLNARPAKASLFQLLGHQAQAIAVPPDQLDPVPALGPEDVDHPRKGIAAVIGTDERRQGARALRNPPDELRP